MTERMKIVLPLRRMKLKMMVYVDVALTLRALNVEKRNGEDGCFVFGGRGRGERGGMGDVMGLCEAVGRGFRRARRRSLRRWPFCGWAAAVVMEEEHDGHVQVPLSSERSPMRPVVSVLRHSNVRNVGRYVTENETDEDWIGE